MAVRYHVIERHNPRDMAAPNKHYPSVKTSGRTNVRKLAGKVANISTVSTIDLMAAIEGLLSALPNELANGNIVDFGDFGTFRLQVKTEGSDVADEVTTRNIKKVSVRFTPGKEFKRALGEIEFVKE